MDDVKIARITGVGGLACVALTFGQFPLWLVGTSPSVYDGRAFATHLFSIKNVAFTRILMDQGIYVSMLVFAAGLRHLIRQARSESEWIGTLLFGAALGWVAVTGELSSDALLLFLIIFAWTPPHFWSLALYRTEEYAKSGLPMLPVTHGKEYTRLQVLLYTIILFGASLLPFAIGMSGILYLVAAAVLGGVFLFFAIRIYVAYSDALAQRTFRFSIAYLAFLFAALLVDHYVA